MTPPRSQTERPAQQRPAPPPPDLGAAALAGAIAAAAGAAPSVPVVSGLRRAASGTVEALADALASFLLKVRIRNESYVRRRLRGLPQDEIMRVIQDENAREAEFQRRSKERLARDAGRVLVGDPTARQAAVKALLDRERVYARQRALAMGERVVATIERVAVKATSPRGGFWTLGPTKTHTAECVYMAGKFWPWEVLDVFHPPLHGGCACRLQGEDEATANGLMDAGSVPHPEDAVRRWRAVLGNHNNGRH